MNGDGYGKDPKDPEFGLWEQYLPKAAELQRKGQSPAEIAKNLNLGRSTIYRYLHHARQRGLLD